MDLLKQIRIAVVGIPDTGKSTFIQHTIFQLTGRMLSPDSLMHEVEYSNGKDIYGNNDTRTIKCAKLFFEYGGYEICMFDCPGHLEYRDEIAQGMELCNCVIQLWDENRIDESVKYFDDILFSTEKPTYKLISHSKHDDENSYDVDRPQHFSKIVRRLLDEILTLVKNGTIIPVDIENEAISLIQKTLPKYDNIGMFFSGGKDSLVGLWLCKKANMIDRINVYYPDSGNDFAEVKSAISEYSSVFNKHIEPFPNNFGKTYDEVSTYDWMSYKALSNNMLIAEKKLDLVLVQFRASDEGVRSKDHFISHKENHDRFSPVFYFSESNIWRLISKYQLPVCELYYKGYRSLGDEFCTIKCMPEMSTADEIVEYIRNHPESTERDGRKKQDTCEKYTMENLRNVGFF